MASIGAGDAGALYRGARLAQAQEWAAANQGRLNEAERAFLAASLAQEQDEEQERERQRQRELAAAQELAEEQAERAKEQTTPPSNYAAAPCFWPGPSC